MVQVLQRPVLVLNRNWQPIEESCVETALCDICRGAKRGIDTSTMTALTWEDWIKLPIRESDEAIQTAHGPVRVPRVMVTAWAGMPSKKPKKNRRGVGLRDKFICAYSGEYAPDGNVDHVVPLGQGGSNEWTNLAWSRTGINHQKGNRTPEQAGLKLRRKPVEPVALPASVFLEPRHPEWRNFFPHHRGGEVVTTK